MRNTTIMIVFLLAGLYVTGVHSDLPTEDKIANTYSGEGVNCDGTSALINLDPNTVVESEEGVVTAVAQVVAQAIDTITANPTTDTVVAEANAAGQLVLEVVARAVATVSAEVNSPNPGCWAIAFGKAEAVAIAEATVTAIAAAFAEAANQDLFAQVDAQVESAEKEVKVVVEEIALLLADGSGSGRKNAQAQVEAVARATAINCALAQAFAAVAEGVAEAEVLTQVGCLQTAPVAQPFFIGASPGSSSACDCIKNNILGAPNHCGLWGQGQMDYICYVKDPSGCGCAVSSSVYSGLSWRYCGPTMKEMQKWLSIDDEENEIFSKPSGFGYCAQLNDTDDKISTAIFPPPPPPTISSCPLFTCIGDTRSCCSQSGPTCTTRFDRTFDYLGKCASTGQDVWAGTFECFCP